MSSSIFGNFHIIGGHQAIRSIVRSCVKSYVCVFVSMSVKAVHLELVSDLSTESFIACLRRFVAQRRKPSSFFSDHGTNFVGAYLVLNELYVFLRSKKTNEAICDFCSIQGIKWHFIPERAPHFGGLWEAAVKSFKTHLKRVVGNSKLDFEEMSTVLAQIEACLNSRPLGTIPHNDDGVDGVEMLTPGHFLIGRPLQAIQPSSPLFPISWTSPKMVPVSRTGEALLGKGIPRRSKKLLEVETSE